MLIVKEWVQGDSYKVHELYLSRGEGMVFLETRAAFLTAAIVEVSDDRHRTVT